MIIENLQKSDVQTIGEVKQIKTSIDVKNIDFITTLLSTNLYSDPIGSFLREIVSNAWDSHVEADNTKEPVIIKLNSNGSVTIRDYGTGLSKEQFEDMYCKIGSSTKRESNNLIGGFGIGKYASIAVSDVVYIKNFYEGICYGYIMIKENNSITTNELNSINTTEHNGLEVTVDVGYKNMNKVERELLKLVFFPNIYVDYGDFAINTSYNVNDAKVNRYKHFSVSSILKYANGWESYKDRCNRLWVLLGNVLYPLEEGKLTCQYDTKQLNNLKNCNICLNVPIGSINVTPNRETILYNEASVNYLSKKLEDALNEIEEILKPIGQKNTDDITEYYNLLGEHTFYDFIKCEVKNYRDDSWEFQRTITYKNVQKSSVFSDVVRCFGDCIVPGFKNICYNGTFYTEKGISWRNRTLSKVTSDNFITIENDKNVSGYTKMYLLSNSKFIQVPIRANLSKEDFVNGLIKHSPYHNIDKSKIKPEALEVAEEFYDRVNMHTTIIHQHDIDSYKQNYLADRPKGRKVDNSLYTLHKTNFDLNTSWNIKMTDSPVKFNEIINILKKQGKVILHNSNTMNADQLEYYKPLCLLGYNIIWCSNKLYDNIIKYIAKNNNRKHLNNIILDYRKELDNPNKYVELQILFSKYKFTYLDSDYKESFFNYLKEIKDIFPTEKSTDCNKEIDKYEDLTTLRWCKWYKENVDKVLSNLKSSYVKSLYAYLQEIFPIVKQYWIYRAHLRSYGLANDYAGKIICKYKIHKYCIHNNIAINLKSYTTCKNNSLIKLIYE